MSGIRVFSLTLLAMLAFAGNSLLCRVALRDTGLDAASFTLVRLLSGAIVLWLIVQISRRSLVGKGKVGKGNWLSALALFAYAAGFSFAYISLSAATGALILFASVQVTMISYGFWSGERFSGLQWLGFLLALVGLLGLFLPGLTAPPLLGSLLMISAGVAWGIYSLRGKSGGDATMVTAGNFLRAVPFGVVLVALSFNHLAFDQLGIVYAIASGALASGIGYAIWYMALPSLQATTAATVQLSVPVISALGGVLFLSEIISLRLILASLAILGGIALVIWQKKS